MSEVTIGKGNLEGKGVYASRDFKEGEIVIHYTLKLLSKNELNKLSQVEKKFTHVHFGAAYLYSEPERYVNHSNNPNTFQDLQHKCDIAKRDIKKGEMITTNAQKDDIW